MLFEELQVAQGSILRRGHQFPISRGQLLKKLANNGVDSPLQ